MAPYLGGKRKKNKKKTKRKQQKRKQSKQRKTSKKVNTTTKKVTFSRSKPKTFSYEQENLFVQNDGKKDLYYYEKKSNPIFIYKHLTLNKSIEPDFILE